MPRVFVGAFKSYVVFAFPSYAFEETLNRYLIALFIWYYIEDENLFSEDDFLLPRAKIIGFDNSFALFGFCKYSSLSVKKTGHSQFHISKYFFNFSLLVNSDNFLPKL